MLQVLHGWYYHTKKYRVAMTKAEQCKVDLVPNWGKTFDKPQLEKMRKEYHEYCPKSNTNSNNIVCCPQEIIKRKNDIGVKWMNDYFKNLVMINKKKKTKPKGKETRSKEYHRYCSKSNSKSNNIVFCPQQIIKRKN